MIQRTFTRFIRSALCLTLSLSIASSATLPTLVMAESRKAFAASSIERAIVESYVVYAGEPTEEHPNPTTENDKVKLALNTFDEIALLRTDQFNNVLLHLAADYHHHPEHRLPIEMIMESVGYSAESDDPGADAVRQALREELESTRTRNPIITVLDDVVAAFGVAYAFQFGKGLWKGTGSGLKGMERLRNTIATVTSEISQIKKARLAIIGIGATAGVTQAIYQSLNTDKMDPRRILKRMQADVIYDAAARAASRVQELQLMLKETSKELADHQLAYRARITEMDAEVTAILSEIRHVAGLATEYQSDEQRIEQDLSKIRAGIAELGGKMDWLELDTPAKRPN